MDTSNRRWHSVIVEYGTSADISTVMKRHEFAIKSQLSKSYSLADKLRKVPHRLENMFLSTSRTDGTDFVIISDLLSVP